MKVLVLSDLWPPFPGGAERLMFNLARHLERSGLEVDVVTGYEAAQRFDGPAFEYAEVPVHEQHHIGARAIVHLVDNYDPDVVIVHHLWAFEFEHLWETIGRPVVQVVLNGHRIPGAALAVFISDFVRRQTTSRWDDLTILPPAFDDVVADTHGDAIGFVKPIPHKGVDLFWRIASRSPHRQFVVLRGEWQGLEDVRYARNVRVMEPVDDMRDFWREVRMVLAPSRSEDAGTIAQEATVNGVPCLSSAVGGLLETNRCGVLLDPDDLRAWLWAIKQLDNPRRYAEVVDAQRAWLDEYDHPRRLDEFAARVSGLGSRA